MGNPPAAIELSTTQPHEAAVTDPFLVSFTTPHDDENPQDWPVTKKWALTTVLSLTGFNRIMVSTIMAPALSTIQRELHMSNVESAMALSAFVLATAFGPLIFGPLSEVYGRKPIVHVTNIWFLVWNIVCGFARNKGELIAARVLAGLGASAIFALQGGVMGDLWRPEHRGKALGLYQLVPLLSVAVGPIIGGAITQATTWRWMFWSTSILQGVMVLICFALYRETHRPTILKERARTLRQSTGESRFHTAEDSLEMGKSVVWVLRKSLTRPIRMLLFHPIVQAQACLSGFIYGLLYLYLSSYATLWTSRYGESISTSGLHYIACALGEITAAQLGARLLDSGYRHLKRRGEGEGRPEYRIPTMIPGAIVTPLGLFIYGWAAQKNLHWLIVDVGAYIFCFGMQLGTQALAAYVIDSYPDHTSSASAATQFVKSMTAFVFPLFAPKMYSVLGYGWGNSLLAFSSIAIGFPAPLLIWKYGARLRMKAQSSY